MGTIKDDCKIKETLSDSSSKETTVAGHLFYTKNYFRFRWPTPVADLKLLNS